MDLSVSNPPDASQKHAARLSDFDLLHRLRKRDAAALRELHERYAGFVGAIAQGVLGDAEAAEKTTQDVFIHLWSTGFNPEEQRGRFLTWLFLLSRTRAIEARRTRSSGTDGGADRTRSVPLLKRGRPDVGDPEIFPLRAEERRRVQSVLEEMDDAERMIIQLSVFDGLTHTEIAAELAAPLDEVRGRLREALHALRSRLAKDAPRFGEREDSGGNQETASDSLESMASAYAIGALDGESLHAFEARLSEGDAILWDRVRDFESTVDALAQWVTAVPPRGDAYATLESRMTEEGFLRARGEEEGDSGLLSMRRLTALVAVLALFALGYAAYRLDAERRVALSDLEFSERGRADLGRELAAAKEHVSDLELRNRRLDAARIAGEEAFASITRPTTRRDWPLKPLTKDLEVKAHAFLDPETGRLWIATEALPILPTEQVYQLWLIMEDEPVDAGIVGTGGNEIRAESAALAPTNPPADPGKLRMAITIEPTGGSPLPTGPMILSGSG